MPDSNPYEPPQGAAPHPADDEPPGNAVDIIRLIPSAILASILLGYVAAYAVARWTRPPPEARLLPLLFFGVPPLVTACAMSAWAIARHRRQRWRPAASPNKTRTSV